MFQRCSRRSARWYADNTPTTLTQMLALDSSWFGFRLGALCTASQGFHPRCELASALSLKLTCDDMHDPD